MKILLAFTLMFMLVPLADADAVILDTYADSKSCSITVFSEHGEKNLNISLRIMDFWNGDVLIQKTIEVDMGDGEEDTWLMLYKELPESSYVFQTEVSSPTTSAERSVIFSTIKGAPLTYMRVSSVVADSSGMAVVLSPTNLFKKRIAKVEFQLFVPWDGMYKMVDYEVEKRVAVQTPVFVEKKWKRVLREGEHLGRVVVTQYTESGAGERRAYYTLFTAHMDGEIEDVYVDRDGASITVLGLSNVPLNGVISVMLVNESNEVVERHIIKAPIVLSGEDEDVEVGWSEKLENGTYVVSITLEDLHRRTLDVYEKVLNVEDTYSQQTYSQQPPPPTEGGAEGNSLLYLALIPVAIIIALVLRRW